MSNSITAQITTKTALSAGAFEDATRHSELLGIRPYSGREPDHEMTVRVLIGGLITYLDVLAKLLGPGSSAPAPPR
jgi:hypothetical protein